MADGRCCVNFVRWLVVAFNILFALCALALLAVGIWIMVDPKAQNIVNVAVDSSDSDSELLKIAAILLIVVAALLLIISLIGIIGAAFEYKVLLGIFMGILVVIFLGEIVGGVLAIIFKDKIIEKLDDSLRGSLQEYFEEGTCKLSDIGEAWNEVQQELECCGIGETTRRGYDMLNVTCLDEQFIKNLPASCYKDESCPETGACTPWQEGCSEKVEDQITYYAPILIGIGIGVAMIQTIGIIFAVCLCVNVPVRAEGYKRHRRG